MSCMPAGAEGDDSDDEFDLGDGKYEHDQFLSEDWESDLTLSSSKKGSLHNEHLQNVLSPKNGSTSPFSRLSKGVSPPRRDQKGSPLLTEDLKIAATKGNIAEVQNFLQRGVKVDTILRGGWTALMYSASNGHAALVKYLLDQGANPNYNLADGMYSPILAACISRCNEEMILECVTLLVDHGADVNLHERSHMTPLMFACQKGLAKLVSKLILCGAQINKEDNRRWTPLCYSALSGNLKIVKILIENKADPTVSCIEGTAADIAYGQEFTEIADYLQNVVNPNSSSLATDNPSQSAEGNDNDDTTPTTDESKRYHMYNDLELFLCGLDLGDLIPVFRQQRVSFADLLQLSEDDLEKMGIKEFGWRRKIMKSVHEIHRIKWERSSIRNPTHKIISQQESMDIMDNISQHIAYITSSLVYIQRNWKEHDSLTDSQKDGTNLIQLSKLTSNTINRVTGLHSQLKKVKLDLIKASKTKETLPADLIPDSDDGYGTSYGMIVLILAGTAVAVAAMYKWAPSLTQLHISR